MKRLLGLLGTTFLTVTTSTSLVACDESKEQTEQTEQTKLKFDIVTRIPNTINLGQLSATTVTTFKNALQANLITLPDLNRISTADYDVYKAGAGENLITDSDIATGNSLSIKIIAKGDTFTGTKDNITANYSKVTQKINIATRIPNTIRLGQLSANTVIAFKNALQENLKTTIPDLNRISTADYDVYKADDGENLITDSDIATATGDFLSIKIIAKGDTFTGTKDNITANYSKVTQKIDIATKIPNTIRLGQLSANTVIAFKTALQANLITIPDLNPISTADYDVYKAGAGENLITDSDIATATGDFLSIKIIAKGDTFTGTKDNITANYSKVTQKINIATRIPNTIRLGQLSANTVIAFKNALQENLKTTIPDLNRISTADYDVYKAGDGENLITDSDIATATGDFLSIKIIAKGDTFTGTKDNITANYSKVTQKIDIATKIPNTIRLGQLSANTVIAFKTALQANLITIPDLNPISTADYDVYKAGAGENLITDSDIATATGDFLSIKIIAKGDTFTGTKDNITANYSKVTQKIDIATKIPNTIRLGQLSANTVIAFKTALQANLITIPDLNPISTADYDVYKAGDGENLITDSDIATGNSLSIKIIAKGDTFIGTKDNITANYKQQFTSVPGWQETNGVIRSLLKVGSDLYVGTSITSDKGKLFKIDSTGAITPVSGWLEANGGVRSLVMVGNNLYVGTNTGTDEGNLFKIAPSSTPRLVHGWQERNGAVNSLVTVGSNLYVGTNTGGEGKLFKIAPSSASAPTLVPGWLDTNGAVTSLVTVGNDLYVGTNTSGNKGKLFKIAPSSTPRLVHGWLDTNGAVNSLLTVGNDLYVGTNTGYRGKLFKINSAGTLASVSNWQESNGAVSSLLIVGNDLYVGTNTNNKGKLFKIDSAGTITSVSSWKESNGAVSSLLIVGNYLYAGTNTNGYRGKLLYKHI